MALVALDDVLVQWGQVNSSAARRARYEQLRQRAEAAVKAWCKWDLEYVKQCVEYYSGAGYADIVLRTPFVDMTDTVTVWMDMIGAGGQGPNAFAAATKLNQGKSGSAVGDYMIENSTGFSYKGQAKAGILRRLLNNYLFFPSDLVYYRGSGGLSYRKPASWPAGYGNIKVQLSFGFDGNATPSKVPLDIQVAVTEMMAILKGTTKYGYTPNAESLGDYNYSLALARDEVFGDVRRLLAPYRDTPVVF